MSLYAAVLVALLLGVWGGDDFEDRRDVLVQQLTVWEPRPGDISSHPVSFLMAKLKNELGRADKTLPAVGILDDLVASLTEPVNEVTEEYTNVLDQYHVLRDMFKHYSNSVCEFFKAVDEFRAVRASGGVTDKSIVEKQIPILLSKVEKMTNQVDTILSNKALSMKVKVLRQKIDEKWHELRKHDQSEMIKIKTYRQANIFSAWLLPQGSREGIAQVNQQFSQLDSYFTKFAQAYAEFKMGTHLLSHHLMDAEKAFDSFRPEDMIISDIYELEKFVAVGSATMFKKINEVFGEDLGNVVVELPKFNEEL
eukprot:TRINITY_DN9782_c0_g1_i1.p1 TRINITY_DN9782_c0_g1~~TRINITY_DN9782_c0_g1_i1.p1  ORF type:complete len:309 (-),score=54.50 TRINITY_DN9782_c0_g1_i1:59-985(-)